MKNTSENLAKAINYDGKALLTANDLCEYLNIGISTAYNLLNSKGFPTVKIKSRKYANKELLDKWLREQAEKTNDDKCS